MLLVASLAVGAAVSAQSGPTAGCSNDNPIQFGTQFFGENDYDNHLLSNGPTELEFAYSLPAGTYNISAVSTDGYEGRSEIIQTEEQWFAQFISGGSVVATTSPTGDVPDSVEQGIWSGSLGEVVLESAIDTVRVVHRAPGGDSQNSVRPVCLGATLTSAQAAAPIESIESSIMVMFDSEGIAESTITLECENADAMEVTGEMVMLITDPVDPGSVCTVGFPAEHDCTMSVRPAGDVEVDNSPGSKVITFPEDTAVDAKVEIFCNAAEEEAEVEVLGEVISNEPAVEEVVPEPPVEVEVLNEVVSAPVAQSTDANPTFTG